MFDKNKYIGKLCYIKIGNSDTETLFYAQPMKHFEGKIYKIENAWISSSGETRFFLANDADWVWTDKWVVVLDEKLFFLE